MVADLGRLFSWESQDLKKKKKKTEVGELIKSFPRHHVDIPHT